MLNGKFSKERKRIYSCAQVDCVVAMMMHRWESNATNDEIQCEDEMFTPLFGGIVLHKDVIGEMHVYLLVTLIFALLLTPCVSKEETKSQFCYSTHRVVAVCQHYYAWSWNGMELKGHHRLSSVRNGFILLLQQSKLPSLKDSICTHFTTLTLSFPSSKYIQIYANRNCDESIYDRHIFSVRMSHDCAMHFLFRHFFSHSIRSYSCIRSVAKGLSFWSHFLIENFNILKWHRINFRFFMHHRNESEFFRLKFEPHDGMASSIMWFNRFRNTNFHSSMLVISTVWYQIIEIFIFYGNQFSSRFIWLSKNFLHSLKKKI